MAWEAAFRRTHRIATLVVGLQLLVWTATGFAFSWFDFDAVRGAGDRAAPAALDPAAAKLSAADAVARARTLPNNDKSLLTAVELRERLGRASWIVRFAQSDPIIVDALDGSIAAPLSPEQAAEAARAAHREHPPLVEVARITEPRAAPDLDVPVYRVRLADRRATDVFIAPATGEIVAWRNSRWRWFDALWSLHVMGYIRRDHPAHTAMRLAAALALFAVLTGAGLLFSTVRRKRR